MRMCLLIYTTFSGKRNVIKTEAKEISNLLNYNRNRANVVCKTIGDTSNNTGNWNHLRIIQKIS